ncbi:short-chain dehydrogenase [Mycolicibacterium madagascariense]|uniref:3-oxoacyl-[acyl-carrier-protein] reductase MabA n=1 Tax=Mycolicibacterium madagascariense TaxID=212765 RepID=A0A7I7X8X4_9MYCO|nr:SDR family oxidoreductase [Mycolicibacterium madagascariense]BBZ25790.1 short-chain dehydrogenase [Mycolicibacterium madagascariense]
MDEPLIGRVALVTGGSRGVGRGIALRLASDGAAVAVNYRRDADAARRVVEDITAAGGCARAYQASVADESSVTEMLSAIDGDLGALDLLVSNAGTASRGTTIADTDRSEYQRLLDVHLLGPLALIRAALPQLRTAGRADVVAISSTITREHHRGAAAYTLAKSALEAAAFTLAREERAHGIRVNIVAPGLVATDMGERLVAATAGATIAELEPSYPFGRTCRPPDVAGIVAFLASRDGEYITGQRITVDGGTPDVGLFA